MGKGAVFVCLLIGFCLVWPNIRLSNSSLIVTHRQSVRRIKTSCPLSAPVPSVTGQYCSARKDWLNGRHQLHTARFIFFAGKSVIIFINICSRCPSLPQVFLWHIAPFCWAAVCVLCQELGQPCQSLRWLRQGDTSPEHGRAVIRSVVSQAGTGRNHDSETCLRINSVQGAQSKQRWEQWGEGVEAWESRGLPCGPGVKNPPASAGDMGSIPGPGRSRMPPSI